MAVACGQCSATQEESSSRLALSQHAVTHASLHNSAHTHVACARTLQLLFSPVSLIALLRMSILAAEPPPLCPHITYAFTAQQYCKHHPVRASALQQPRRRQAQAHPLCSQQGAKGSYMTSCPLLNALEQPKAQREVRVLHSHVTCHTCHTCHTRHQHPKARQGVSTKIENGGGEGGGGRGKQGQ